MVMPPMGAAPILPDPEAIYRLATQVREAMEQQAELLMQPVYPPWYDPEKHPEPDPAAALAKARELEAEFGPLRSRIDEEFRLTRNEYFGAYRDYDQDEDDAWLDTMIAGEVELFAYQLADAQLSFDAKARTLDLQDEAAKKVDFALACQAHAETLHARAGNGPLAIEKARTALTTGRLAWTCQLNLDAGEGEMPFIEHLVDPTSCYPVFEAHKGMRLMVRAYQTTVGDAVAHLDDAQGTMYRKLVAQGAADRRRGKRDEAEHCEVVEYIDRRWRLIFVDDEPVRSIEHAYGFVPYVYKLGPLGTPGYMRDPNSATFRSDGVGERWRHHARDVAQPFKGVGLPSLLKTAAMQREAIYTRMNRAFKTSMNPALITYMDDVTYNQGVPDISQSPGDNSPAKLNRQQVEEIHTNPNANVLMPILQGSADNASRLTQPPTAHGLNDHSNVSGYATQGLNEAGRIKLKPWLLMLEEFEAECMEMRFRMFRDWGYLITQGEGEYGTLAVPRHDAGPDEEQVFDLTPGDLRRAGIAIEVSMSQLPMQMLGPLANAIGQLMQMGLMDKIGALKLLNTQNPYKTLQRIQQSQVLDDPVLIEADVIEGLFASGQVAKGQYVLARKMNQKLSESMGAGDPLGTMGDSHAANGAGPGPGSGPPGPRTMPPPDPRGTEP